MFEQINVDELKEIVGKADIIDVREEYEYAMGYVPTAKNIPVNEIANNHSKYLDKNKTYYIICQSGSRSMQVCVYLKQLGYNVVNVQKGTGYYGMKYKLSM